MNMVPVHLARATVRKIIPEEKAADEGYLWVLAGSHLSKIFRGKCGAFVSSFVMGSKGRPQEGRPVLGLEAGFRTKISQTLWAWLCSQSKFPLRGSYEPIELATEENTLFELDPINRMVPTTSTRMTANMTAYSAMSWPSSSVHKYRKVLMFIRSPF
jgi:hypothetical protein